MTLGFASRGRRVGGDTHPAMSAVVARGSAFALLGAGCIALAVWRVDFAGSVTNYEDPRHGLCPRAHAPLIALQALLAFVAAWLFLALAVSKQPPRPRLIGAAVALAIFALIFLYPDLGALGACES